jgi:murein DD-endopeptidase MepM/ murein hydrolase activator NlpD
MATTATNNKIVRFDILSAPYESSGDAGCVSDGAGDLGGVSYGLYQLASGVSGKVESFVDFCVEKNYALASTLKAAYPPGSDPFTAAWKQVAATDYDGFAEIQYQYAYSAHFVPAVDACASIGVDLNKHSDALKCVVWSVAIQYPAHVTTAFEEAASAMGQPLSALDDIKYDGDLIQTIYFLRGSDSWISSSLSADVRAGVKNRMVNECQDALALLSGDGATISKIIVSRISEKAAGKASDDGFSTKSKPHGKHMDSVITKLPKGKTFCEPVYPDLVTVSDKIPTWLLEKANIPLAQMNPNGMMMYEIPTQVLQDACGGDLNTILGSASDAKARQRIFNSKDYKKEFKAPNPGKPANNNDPFPVDLKIEELETHKPTIKIHTITCCPEAVPVAKAVLNVSDRVEKRIVKLENMMATITRYLFRMANRVQINCVYYGGQTPFEKYNGIRCLQDDRISDGQLMSLDQCMNCTRYEPIIGQVYEILNDTGANLAAILDDNQMSFMDMQNYADFTRVENYHKELDAAIINTNGVTVRSGIEKDFKDMWPKGVEMQWDLVPVEEQKTHVNWRQSVNDDGSKLKKLASFPMDEKNVGRTITAKSANAGVMQKNANKMNVNENTVLQTLIDQGKQYMGGVTDEFMNLMKGGLEKDIKSKLGTNTDVDLLIIAAIMAITGARDAAPVVQRYSEVMATLQIKNPAVVISAYQAQATIFNGSTEVIPNIPRIDQVVRTIKADNGNTTPSTGTFGLNWDSRETWLWTDFAEPMSLNLQYIGAGSSSVMSFFPSVCYIYLELLKVARRSRFDGELFAFPFLEEQLNSVWYVSKYGQRQLDSESQPRMHYGIDLATGESGRGMEIHAIADGVVASPSGWEDWNTVAIQHADGYYSRYLHNTSICVSPGQVVAKGDVVATVGDAMSPGCVHLHLEIGQGDPVAEKSQFDPATFFPTLETKFGDGDVPLLER